MRNIYTPCYSIDEANEIGHFVMSKGYEGVKNDSYRYCDFWIKFSFNENLRHHNGIVYIGVSGCSMLIGKSNKYMKRYGSRPVKNSILFKKLLERYNYE